MNLPHESIDMGQLQYGDHHISNMCGKRAIHVEGKGPYNLMILYDLPPGTV